MLLKGLWDEIKEKWPRAFWDDWMRDSAQRKGRACLRPEVSRTQTFGKVGVSNRLSLKGVSSMTNTFSLLFSMNTLSTSMRWICHF
eukprot:m.13952 g.13952  ORF g.13952 m.13952 type:complete len:86 (+) comp25336_c0_seq4:118-375(+)